MAGFLPSWRKTHAYRLELLWREAHWETLLTVLLRSKTPEIQQMFRVPSSKPTGAEQRPADSIMSWWQLTHRDQTPSSSSRASATSPPNTTDTGAPECEST